MVEDNQITNGLSSEYIIHPGVTLKEIIDDRNISQKELSLCTGVSTKHVSSIISGDSNISVSYAKKLEYALGISSKFWINLQANYDQELNEFNEANSISDDEIKILNILSESIKDFIGFGLLSEQDSRIEKVLKLRTILGISNLCDIPKLSYAAAYRISKNINPYILFSWQKMCEIKNKDIVANNKIDVNKLKSSLKDIKRLMFLEENKMKKQLTQILSNCGIIFDVVHNYKGAPVQGYIKRISKDNLLLCMTNRGKYMDIFWFTLFHEIAHIINGDIKNHFVDFENINSENEAEADNFAKNTLIDYDDYISFINTDYESISNIHSFAKKCEVDDSIVYGRLLKENLIDYVEYGSYRKKYSF